MRKLFVPDGQEQGRSCHETSGFSLIHESSTPINYHFALRSSKTIEAQIANTG
jgi:hypothetical protein